MVAREKRITKQYTNNQHSENEWLLTVINSEQISNSIQFDSIQF
jgi:hypothetical protein